MPVETNAPRHQCFLYEGAPSTHLAPIAQTLTVKLGLKHRCLYLNSPAMVAGMRWHLAAAGVDVTEQIARGSLILTSDQSHLVNGKFDVERMLQLLQVALAEALEDGYAGLWAAGDMTWEFGGEPDLHKLANYERKLDIFINDNPGMSGICLYHRDTLPSHAIETALTMHPSLYRYPDLSEINPRYYQFLPGSA